MNPSVRHDRNVFQPREFSGKLIRIAILDPVQNRMTTTRREVISPNQSAAELWSGLQNSPATAPGNPQPAPAMHQIAGATVLDFGVQQHGTLEGGVLLGRACMGNLGRLSVVPCDEHRYCVANGVMVRTDSPLLSCLGCQYAGWPVQTDDFFAMGSGPMRLLRGREPVLEQYNLEDTRANSVCGVLEADRLPSESAVLEIAKQCQVEPERLVLGIAPSTSVSGSIQIVARSVETSMHKLHDLSFDLNSVLSGTGFAPLPPPAGRGQTIAGIGRTNDAMLYGATVTLWVDCDDEQIEAVLSRVPSNSSSDYGRPFEKIFADYDHDFYKVDPSLFSPARVTFHNLRSGRSFSAGEINSEVLCESFVR